MTAEFDDRGVLRTATTGAMYATYVAHAGAYLAAVNRPSRRLPVPSSIAGPFGAGTAVLGTLLCGAGMNRFTGAGQVSGTTTGPFVTAGAYRYTRNPQYTGYILDLCGVAFARRSLAGLALAVAAAGAFAWWVPVEERHLLREFGAEYQDYLDHTPRWLGLTPRSLPADGSV